MFVLSHAMETRIAGAAAFFTGTVFRYDGVRERAGYEAPRLAARMAKLADAADLKSAGRKVVGVQVPLRAPVQHVDNKQPDGSLWEHNLLLLSVF